MCVCGNVHVCYHGPEEVEEFARSAVEGGAREAWKAVARGQLQRPVRGTQHFHAHRRHLEKPPHTRITHITRKRPNQRRPWVNDSGGTVESTSVKDINTKTLDSRSRGFLGFLFCCAQQAAVTML